MRGTKSKKLRKFLKKAYGEKATKGFIRHFRKGFASYHFPLDSHIHNFLVMAQHQKDEIEAKRQVQAIMKPNAKKIVPKIKSKIV